MRHVDLLTLGVDLGGRPQIVQLEVDRRGLDGSVDPGMLEVKGRELYPSFSRGLVCGGIACGWLQRGEERELSLRTFDEPHFDVGHCHAGDANS